MPTIRYSVSVGWPACMCARCSRICGWSSSCTAARQLARTSCPVGPPSSREMPGLTWSARRSPSGVRSSSKKTSSTASTRRVRRSRASRSSSATRRRSVTSRHTPFTWTMPPPTCDACARSRIQRHAAIAADHAVLELGVLLRGERVAREELVVRQTVARMDRRLPRVLGPLVGAQWASEDPLYPGPGVQLAVRVVRGEDARVEMQVERPADLLVGLAGAPEQVDERAHEGADADQDRDPARGSRDVERSGAGSVAHDRHRRGRARSPCRPSPSRAPRVRAGGSLPRAGRREPRAS